VTLYPFEERAGGLDDAGAIEEIDIGGVALLRAAAKNHDDVIVLHEAAQYAPVIEALERGVTAVERRAWAMRAFARTARYDAAIATELARRSGEDSPPWFLLALERARGLRYGENPHQEAALYARAGKAGRLAAWREGKELSYNNLLDLEAAVGLVLRFEGPACVIVKHGQPCGVASAANLADACTAALASDSLSAFGGVVACNRQVEGRAAEILGQQFLECVSAPAFDPGAEAVFKSKKNLRLVSIAAEDLATPEGWSLRTLGTWALLQREPEGAPPPWKCVTRREPTTEERTALQFAWEIAAAARSNAIAIARGTQLIGLGSGQTSRIDAVDVALMKARRAGHELKGSGLASDGFFPFADSIEHAALAGVTAVVQPGGSVRDAEVIAACDRHGIAMMFTDRRTFRH